MIVSMSCGPLCLPTMWFCVYYLCDFESTFHEFIISDSVTLISTFLFNECVLIFIVFNMNYVLMPLLIMWFSGFVSINYGMLYF